CSSQVRVLVRIHPQLRHPLFPYTTLFRSRNLDHRKELLVPVESEHCRQRLMEILLVYFRDTVKASELKPNGLYERVQIPDAPTLDQKSTRLNSSHVKTSYAVFCLKRKKIE